MLSETIALPRDIKGSENRFIISLKGHLLKHVKEINKLEEKTGSNFENYYTKDQTYTKEETGEEIATAINNIEFPADVNTTYTLTKSGSTIVLAGTDGSTYSVTDVGSADTAIPTSTIDSLF